MQHDAPRCSCPVPQDPTDKLRAKIPDVRNDLTSSGGDASAVVPYLARDPVQSLLQSTVESKLREKGVHDATPDHRNLLSKIVHTVESVLAASRMARRTSTG